MRAALIGTEFPPSPLLDGYSFLAGRDPPEIGVTRQEHLQVPTTGFSSSIDMGMLLWIVEGHESTIASIKEDANVVPSFAHGAISCRRFLFRIVSTRFPNPTSVSAWGSNSCHGSAPAGLIIV